MQSDKITNFNLQSQQAVYVRRNTFQLVVWFSCELNEQKKNMKTGKNGRMFEFVKHSSVARYIFKCKYRFIEADCVTHKTHNQTIWNS